MIGIRLLLLVTAHLAQAASPTWVSLNVSVPPMLIDGDDAFNYVDMFVGTPPQLLSLPIDMQSDLISVYSNDCPFCPGTTLYDSRQSSSAKDPNKSLNGTAQLNGKWISDSIGFGGVVQAEDISIAMINTLSTNLKGVRTINGGFGFQDGLPRNNSIRKLIPELYATGQLLNPVVGMRLDPLNPKLTIGALDPNDYDGEINWVQLEPNNAGDNLYNQFKVDGIVGRNGTMVPYGDNLLGGINSLFLGIAVPDNFTWSLEEDFTGPFYNHSLSIDASSGRLSVGCSDNAIVWGPGVHVPTPYVDFTVQINGVKYMMDSQEIVRSVNASLAPKGFCSLVVRTSTVKGKPDFWFGLPFLRSIYIAYRLPTGECPGYYGFAFPKGANRTQEQISQKPRSTPAQMSQCLNLAAPTSTPTLAPPPAPEGSSVLYSVYGQEGLQVPLKGVEFLKKGVWNVTA
ncbi:aspartic peptidase domain-containing protein [Cristinia sonorae]|uniref:Aspartic peptidase domain-containing protein n=1 Tax=Cristinia sonorae TaxID=1940300 RepID=A0A8K0UTF2_9AGAR|nr:aspartic peptidase domain-containing protein [Cristinia sonorae]